MNQGKFFRTVFFVCICVGMFGCYRDPERPTQITTRKPVPDVNTGVKAVESAPARQLEGKATGESLSQFGKTTANIIHGEVISVDVGNQKMRIRDIATDNQIEISVGDPSTLPSFVPGDRVRATFPSSDPAVAISVVAEENWKQ